jgi:hypothetical protein
MEFVRDVFAAIGICVTVLFLATIVYVNLWGVDDDLD